NIYNTFEDEIIPAFYERNDAGIPEKWVQYMKNTIQKIAPEFTMHRMLNDYQQKFYNKLIERSDKLRDNDFEQVRLLSSWKRKMLRGWDSIEIVNVNLPDSSKRPLRLGEKFTAEIIVNVNELSASDIGIEVLFGNKVNDEVKTPTAIEEMNVAGIDGNIVSFFIELPTTQGGVFDYAIRMFPKHPLLP
ncbi:MAG TPA: hypothetical protein DCL86_08725, partial [Bacteroidales bacterium]|nr:hypothetical protein [Bacteroidales bacterium]